MPMNIKQWPDDDKPASFEDITDPLCAAVRFCYNLERQNQDLDIPYEGFDIGKHCSHVSFGAKEKFTVNNMRYSDEDQGRDALTEIIGFAVQIGMEQGRRIDADKRNRDNRVVKMVLKATLTEAGMAKAEIDNLISLVLR